MPILIDLCSGTGLSLGEMFRVFNLEDVAVKAVGIELNEAMLQRSQTKTADCIRDSGWTVPGTREIQFVKGDAYRLTKNKKTSSDLSTFEENSISCITNVFGVCGLKDPLQSFTEQLKVLEPGGSIIAIDVHRPIPPMTPAWPFEKYISWPAFEQIAWDRVTVPLVLNMFWAWEDPTITFYTVPLLTIQGDSDGKYYGFKLMYRLLRTENWWFGLPVMPTAVMILQKVEIKAAEAHERNQLLERIPKNF
jgi:SAM-dependent methyltransferase